ncbi:DUF4355 domain-containing protein [Oceanobacillus oncorhynchi]|uniref:DUF4355 domain-containing protein n=1 Tax=Oceanobacillus oncorhynchi TaxID=545501 RepID=UPI0018690EE4|nr:DUF4355 domain-containing protein [Oceanobacillus oncorhynchi]
MNELMDKVKKLAIETPFTEGEIASSLTHRAQRGLALDLQFFAEGGEGAGQGDGGEGGQKGESGNGEGGNSDKTGNENTFTQSEVDSQVSKAIESFKKNQEPKQQEAINQAVKDALAEQQRLSKLSEKERQDEELTQREQQLEKDRKELNRKLLRSDAVADLQEKKLPSDFADILLGEDAESTLANIKTFKDAFDSAVNDAVKEKLRQDTPPAGNAGGSSSKDNLGKQLAQLNKQNSVDVEKAQGNYFK